MQGVFKVVHELFYIQKIDVESHLFRSRFNNLYLMGVFFIAASDFSRHLFEAFFKRAAKKSYPAVREILQLKILHRIDIVLWGHR